MGKKQNNYYFESFIKLIGYCSKAADTLCETLTSFNPDNLSKTTEYLHEIEHSADIEKHYVMDKLVREFITPIEREDIIALTQNIDDVTDAIEDVLIRMYMFNIQTIREPALEFCNLIVKCCNRLELAFQDFPSFKKSATIHSHIVEVNRLEEEGDALYTEAMRALYSSENNPIDVMRWTVIYDRFEKCCDACECVANTIESIIMKNS